MEITTDQAKELLFKVSSPEEKYRVNVKVSAKGHAYFDVTTKANTREEIQKQLKEVIEIAKKQCEELNEENDTREII